MCRPQITGQYIIYILDPYYLYIFTVQNWYTECKKTKTKKLKAFKHRKCHEEKKYMCPFTKNADLAKDFEH